MSSLRYAVASSRRRAGGAGDPFWPDTVALVSFNGTPGATTSPDLTGRHTVSFANAAALSSSRSIYAATSVSVSSSGDKVSLIGNLADYDFGLSTDFTLETYLWVDSSTTTGAGLNLNGAGGASVYLVLAGGIFYLGNGSSNPATAAYAGYYDKWTHLAATRQGATTRIFLDGVLVNTGGNATFGGHTAGTMDVNFFGGSYATGNYNWTRITRACRYTTNFTPPTTFPTYP